MSLVLPLLVLLAHHFEVHFAIFLPVIERMITRIFVAVHDDALEARGQVIRRA